MTATSASSTARDQNAIAEYLYGSGYPIDVDHMGDFLFDDRMAETPEYEIRLKGE